MVKLLDIIGLPPDGSFSVGNNLRRNTMPIVEITPCIPDSGKSPINIYSLQPARNAQKAEDNFDAKLADLGYSVSNPIRFAFQADSMPTDSFSNEYGETFLNKIADVASEGIGELMQMTNTSTAMEAARKIGAGLKGMGSIGAAAGGLLETKANQLQEWVNKNKGGMGTTGAAAGGVELVSKMLAGQRVDFPMIWKNSAFNPSYSITIKLFNPKPGDLDVTNQYIIGPIALILLLALPQSDESGETYKWPYFHRIKSSGLFNIKAGAITNVSISKGGDQNTLAWNQRLSQVDIRIDFISLYNSLIVGGKEDLDRPTLKSYLETLKAEEALLPIYGDIYSGVSKRIVEEEFDDVMRATIPSDAKDPYDAEVDRVSPQDSIKEEDIIDESGGKIPVPEVTSDLRSRDMEEIATDAGGSTTTGELATKSAAERFNQGLKTVVTAASNTQQKLKEVALSAGNTLSSAVDTGLKFLKR